MSNAIETQGTTFGVSASGTSPITYTAVGEVTSFSGLDGQASEIEVSHLGSVAKEFLKGLKDNGSFTIEVNFLSADTGQDLLRTAQSNRDLHYFRLTLSDNTFLTFAGYVLSAPIDGGVDGAVLGSFTIRITGDVTWSA